MKPHGATLVSAGILAGNNILKESNSQKLMIILSDGEDTYLSKNISKELINKGMCEKIKDNGTRMVFIKIGYKSSNINWKKCVGSGNYYEAHNVYQLEADLMQALGATEIREVGRNTPKD
ncbi:vWA domain-containing protein [Yersinia proxima]|nr:hypothetical protein [Yersinia proxima]